MKDSSAVVIDIAPPSVDGDLSFIANPAMIRPVLDAISRDCVAYFTTLDETGRWLLADIGRASIYTAALVLDARPDGLTMNGLATISQFAEVSRGRVSDFMNRALAEGEFVLKTGPEAWTRRRLAIHPRFSERLRRRCMIDARAVGRLDPCLTGADAWLRDEAVFRRFLFWLGVIATREQESVQGDTPMKLFLHSDGGGRLLMALLAAQPAGRIRLLETATISRSALARACSISRPHINRLLGTAEAAGLIAFDGERRIEIAPALSDGLEHTLCRVLHITRAALKAAVPA